MISKWTRAKVCGSMTFVKLQAANRKSEDSNKLTGDEDRIVVSVNGRKVSAASSANGSSQRRSVAN